MPSYRTIAANSEALGEFVDRRSRFIASLRHAASEREADSHLAEVRALHHDARHHVPAWVLADGRERCSDDGEPQRTAGAPTLEVLRGAGLANVSCVVTRYFGGTLLGPGGLVRAYTAAAQEALSDAEARGLVVEMTLVTHAVCQIPYALYDRARNLAERCGGKVGDSLFAEDVQLTVAFRAGEEEPFAAAMRELANGDDLVAIRPPSYAEF